MVKQAGWVRAGPPPALRATSARLDSRAGTTAAARGSRESRYPPPPDVLVQRPGRMPPLDPGFCKRQLQFVHRPIGFVGHLSCAWKPATPGTLNRSLLRPPIQAPLDATAVSALRPLLPPQARRDTTWRRRTRAS